MDRRERIIEVARGLIARYGFKKTTMSDIAQAAGVAKATLYHYFRSKEDILREIINVEGNLMRSRLLEVVEKDMRASEKLRSYSETRMHYLRQLVVFYNTLSEEYYSHIPFIERERERFDMFELQLIKRILEQGIESGQFRKIDPEKYAFVMLQSMKALEIPLATGHALKIGTLTMQLDEMLDVMLDILLNGISASG